MVSLPLSSHTQNNFLLHSHNDIKLVQLRYFCMKYLFVILHFFICKGKVCLFAVQACTECLYNLFCSDIPPPPTKLYILHTNIIPYIYCMYCRSPEFQYWFLFFDEFTLKTESSLVSLFLCREEWRALAQGFIKWLLKQSRCTSVYWLLQTFFFKTGQTKSPLP